MLRNLSFFTVPYNPKYEPNVARAGSISAVIQAAPSTRMDVVSGMCWHVFEKMLQKA